MNCEIYHLTVLKKYKAYQSKSCLYDLSPRKMKYNLGKQPKKNKMKKLKANKLNKISCCYFLIANKLVSTILPARTNMKDLGF